MSLYYFTQKHLTKTKNSAIAAAAYRSGESLYSERDLESKFYGQREVDPETFIKAPPHAPEWVYKREKLWNKVEEVEQIKNARIAKELIIALPVEIDEKQQRELIEKFVDNHCVAKGMVADVAIHRDKKHNPHAHVLLTVRPFNEDGSWGYKKKRIPKLIDGKEQYNEKGKKITVSVPVNDWYDKKTLLNWRSAYADIVNDYYKANGLDHRVSEKSYVDQGLDKQPKIRISWKEYQIENEAKLKAQNDNKKYKPITDRAKQNQRIDNYNKLVDSINNTKKSLSDYRVKYENSLLQDLNSIRKKEFDFTEDQWKDIKSVARRVGGFVDYEKALKAHEYNLKWGTSLQVKLSKVAIEKNVLETANKDYATNPKKVLLYGFNPSTFKEKELPLKEEKLNKQLNDLNKKISLCTKQSAITDNVLKMQEQIVTKEFNFLFPDVKINDKPDTVLLKAMQSYVNDFRKHGTLNEDEVNKQFLFLSNNTLLRETSRVVDQLSENKRELYITNVSKDKNKNRYAESIKSKETSERYKYLVKYQHAMSQLNEHEKHKQELDKLATSQILKIYPHEKEQSIQELSYDTKRFILNQYIASVRNGTDIQSINNLDNKYRDLNKGDEKETKQIYKESSNKSKGEGENIHVGKDEKKNDDLEKDRLKNKKKIKGRGDLTHD
ncbi:MobQ family relaxase [Alkalicoccobacillus gibsonii]|uniref:MobQ family relaxase n=1 Tax=Alkalicoccobacillus gibsonii TaxID=79881 RepID=A0ABU9VP66_9BACI